MAVKNRADLITQLMATIFPNGTGAINAADHQTLLNDILDSFSNLTDDNSFLDLNDSPASYVGQTGLFLAVNGAEDGLEFVAGGGGSQDLQSVLDQGSTATITTAFNLAVNSGASFDIATNGGGNMQFTSSNLLNFAADGNVELCSLSGQVNLISDADLSISNITSGNIDISSVNDVLIQGLTYPSSDGTNGQVLTTDGSGNLTFTTVGGGGGNTIYNSDDTLLGNRIVTLGANTLTFTGNQTTFVGGGNTDATTALLVQNSDLNTTFVVNDNGEIGIGTTVQSGTTLHSVSPDATSGTFASTFVQGGTGQNIMSLRGDRKVYFNNNVAVGANPATHTPVISYEALGDSAATGYSIKNGVASFEIMRCFAANSTSGGFNLYDSNVAKIQFYSQANVVNYVNNGGGFIVGNTVKTTDTKFEVVSTTEASIPAPKMSTAQRDAIASPSAGMMIYNTTTNTFDFYDGSVWGNI